MEMKQLIAVAIACCLSLAGAAYAQDGMKKDEMKKDGMMKKDEMKKDGMAKKDEMKKGDGMMKKDDMKKDEMKK
jgi:pentapeptide MXKDX repeat protein